MKRVLFVDLVDIDILRVRQYANERRGNGFGFIVYSFLSIRIEFRGSQETLA